MKKNYIHIPESFNYIGAFLTLSCNFRCSYCINRFSDLLLRPRLQAEDWINFINRIKTRPDLPISLQGGEPTLHPEFYDIVNNIDKKIPLDLLTNGNFDVNYFMSHIHPDRFKRDAPYASIRFSFHPSQMSFLQLIDKATALQQNGYSVGIWAIDHPENEKAINEARIIADETGVDFRVKEFLGYYAGKLYGTYKYDGAFEQSKSKTVECKTTELLISPNGAIHRCHSDLYVNANPYATIHSTDLCLGEWRACNRFGYCNPCDVKIKTNRFQEFGHTSVEIKI